MNDFSPLRIIVVGDGDTDYLFLEKAVRDDPGRPRNMTTDRRIKRICPFNPRCHIRSGNIRFIPESVVIFPGLPKIRYNQEKITWPENRNPFLPTIRVDGRADIIRSSTRMVGKKGLHGRGTRNPFLPIIRVDERENL
ncbi:hypothetical protein QUF72_10695 [Desulfobacterales bacterium HSG2]|nr:hypothetical protein [Desulfobacterales bacterium HSG2]